MQKDLEPEEPLSGIPQVELAANNSILQADDLFDANMSNIYINPNEISINLQTNRMNSLTSKPSQERHKETIIELVDNVKGNAIFNFTKELENAETPTESPLSQDQWSID